MSTWVMLVVKIKLTSFSPGNGSCRCKNFVSKGINAFELGLENIFTLQFLYNSFNKWQAYSVTIKSTIREYSVTSKFKHTRIQCDKSVRNTKICRSDIRSWRVTIKSNVQVCQTFKRVKRINKWVKQPT